MMIDRNIHLAYFDPKKGHMRNPGMGIHAYVFSDHMHYGFNAAQFSKTEHEAPNRKLKRETLDRMLQLPYTDNLYFRTDWCNIQKERAGCISRRNWNGCWRRSGRAGANGASAS